MNYDLEQRTLDFSKNVLIICKGLTVNTVNRSIVNQLLRSATSVGANYREANGAISKKDFCNKIHISKKEAKETLYWLNLLKEIENETEKIEVLEKEAHELVLIFSKIASSSRV